MKGNKRGWWQLRAIPIAAVLLIIGCGGGGTPTTTSPGELTLLVNGGTYSRAQLAAYIQPFANETGIKLNLVQAGSSNFVSQIQAQESSGNVLWDLVTGAPSVAAANPTLFEQIDLSVVHTQDLLYPGLVGKTYASTDIEAAPIFGYSTKVFPTNGPKSWADFFDTKTFPGPRGLGNTGIGDAATVPAVALLADGVAPEQLYPLDLNRAYAKLATIRSSIRVFYTSSTQSQDIQRSGEVVMNTMSDGRCLQLKYTPLPVECVFQGGFRSGSGYLVLKGAPHKANAMKFLNFVYTHPNQQAIFTSLTYYGPPTNAGVAATDKLGVADYSSKHVTGSGMVPLDDATIQAYIHDNSSELLSRYNKWIGA
jgi:spermidine/putrescine-binding protein